MVVAALKSVTWATVAGAVVSALLLAYGGGNAPRLAAGEGLHASPASTVNPAGTPGSPATPRRDPATRAALPH